MPRVFFGCSYCERTFATEEECLTHEIPCKDGEVKTAAPRAPGTRRGGARGRRGRRPRRLDDAIKAISVAYTIDDALRQQCDDADVVACLEQLVQTTLDTVDSRVKARKTRSAIGAKQRLLNQLEADELLYGVRSAKKARKSRAPQRLDLDGEIFDDLIGGGISAELNEVSSHDCYELPYPFIRKRARRRRVQRLSAVSQVVADTSGLGDDGDDAEDLSRPIAGSMSLRPRRSSRRLAQLDGSLGERRGSGAQPFECPHCECRYKSSFDMQVHVMRKHTGERPYKCPQPGCSRAFVTPYALDNHRETHKANTKDYICVQCQVGFKTERNLRKHNAVYHVEESDFRCEQCDLAFKTAAKRDSHLRQAHRATGQFQCIKCPRKFVNQFSLNRHILSRHEDVRPFRCEHCPPDAKTFQSLQDLKYHTRVAHPEQYEEVKRLTLADFPEAKMIMTQNALSGRIIKASFPVSKVTHEQPQQQTAAVNSHPQQSHTAQSRQRQRQPKTAQATSMQAQTLSAPSAHGHAPNYVVDNDDNMPTRLTSTPYINVGNMIPVSNALSLMQQQHHQQQQQQNVMNQVIAASSTYLAPKLQTASGYSWPPAAHTGRVDQHQQQQQQQQAATLIGYQLTQHVPTTAAHNLMSAPTQVVQQQPMNFSSSPFIFNSFM